jgi:hypothetical protein
MRGSLARWSGAGHENTGVEAGVGLGFGRFLAEQKSEVSEFLLFPLANASMAAYSSAVEQDVSWSGEASGSAGNKGSTTGAWILGQIPTAR